jgi:hypothetical protein
LVASLPHQGFCVSQGFALEWDAGARVSQTLSAPRWLWSLELAEVGCCASQSSALGMGCGREGFSTSGCASLVVIPEVRVAALTQSSAIRWDADARVAALTQSSALRRAQGFLRSWVCLAGIDP